MSKANKQSSSPLSKGLIPRTIGKPNIVIVGLRWILDICFALSVFIIGFILFAPTLFMLFFSVKPSIPNIDLYTSISVVGIIFLGLTTYMYFYRSRKIGIVLLAIAALSFWILSDLHFF